MSKKICIDGHNLARQHGTGVATYARNLANTLGSLGHEVHTLYGAPISPRTPALLREVLFYDYLGGASVNRTTWDSALQYVREAIRAPFGAHAFPIDVSGNVERRRFTYRLPDSSRIFNSDNLFNVARAYFKRHRKFLEVRFDDPPDVMHWTYPLPVRVAGVPNIYTIHDLVPLRLPYTTLDNKKFYYRLIKKCLETSDRICTVSEQSKTDIETLFSVKRDLVVNTYQSVEIPNALTSKGDDEIQAEIRGIYGLEPQGYILFFGAIEPKKNVGRLIEAYLSTHLRAKLVIAGSLAWQSEDEMKLYTSLLKQDPTLKSRIQLIGYAPYSLLISLIRGAKAIAFPSLYEGFGLPVLEAMQLGVPTLCSGESSLPEIAGNASRFVDPYDVASIARGLRDLDEDPDLRAELSARGKEQAKKFDALNYRRALESLYRF